MPKTTAVTLQREKCIGCNYCVQIAPHRWAISKQDGKSVLLGSIDKRGFWSVRVPEHEREESLVVANVCPVKIIKVSE